jgi:spore coat polysaccharide biosynthesis protein SpsF (cytidylyltransferase family)
MLAIITARMSSKRLPGKMLMDLAGESVLQRAADRVKDTRSVTKVVIATSLCETDDIISEQCSVANIDCFRGSLQNVAKRFLDCAKFYKSDAAVRISGDSPLIDSTLIEKAIALYKKSTPDLVTNVFPRTYPKGQSVEVINVNSFEKVSSKWTSSFDTEHVTTALYKTPGYKIASFSHFEDYSDVQLSVDNLRDLQSLEKILKQTQPKASWEQLALAKRYQVCE